MLNHCSCITIFTNRLVYCSPSFLFTNKLLGGIERQNESTEGCIMIGFDRITFDSQIMGGRACVRGMRVTVSLILNLVANGMSTEEILDTYPYIERDDIRQALHYAAWLAEEELYPMEIKTA